MLDKGLWAYLWELEKLWKGKNHFQANPGLYMRNISGKGLDLKDIRLYQPGDDVRRIDWNAQARTGEVYTREYLEEQDIRIHFFLDTSSSMIPFQNHSMQCLLFYSIIALSKKYKLYWSFFDTRVNRTFHFSNESDLFSGVQKNISLWNHDYEGIKTDISIPFREMESKTNSPSLVVILSDFHQSSIESFPKNRHFYAGIRYFIPSFSIIDNYFLNYDPEYRSQHNESNIQMTEGMKSNFHIPVLEYDASLSLETSLKRNPLLL
jgi:hypothetical protein